MQTYTYTYDDFGNFASRNKNVGTMLTESFTYDSTKNGYRLHYVQADNLGSWTTITDSLGNVVERNSFDAWGNRRNAATWSGTPNSLPGFDRGYTGHEHLYDFGLINMNGRVYDPYMSTFLSPDRYMQDPTTQQGFNRYAYCMYNPLKYVDPSGERIVGPDPWFIEALIAEEVVNHARRYQYDIAMASNGLTQLLSSNLYSHGHETNGSGNHGSPIGGGSDNSVEPTENSNGEGEPTNNSNNSNSNGIPGSSEDNPISTSNLTNICDVWYAVGNENPLYVDNSIMDFWFLSQGDLTQNKDGNYTINLFVFPYMLIAPDLAMVLGQITFEYVGDNMYRMLPDKYNFDVKDGEYFSNWRNFATSLGGILHGGINEPTFLLHPATYWGGEFEINFLNNVYIKPGP